MNAALYARKSTEQRVAAEAKSVTRQVENGRAYATRKGWGVAPAHVFVDDAISGAEFERRPGFQAMLAAAKRREFQVLVVAEQKALGREMSETPYHVKQLALVGVEVWSYLEDKLLTPRDSASKLTAAVQAFADEDQRTKTALRVHEGQARHAALGHAVGGRVFGYRNKHVYSGVDKDGNRLRSHVERKVVPAEAAVVRRIFKLFDGGVGLKGIAHALNADRVPWPRYSPPKDGLPALNGWAPNTIKAIIGREVYHGVLTWNRLRKRNAWGQIKTTQRPESDVVRVKVEELRVVPEDLWRRVQARREVLGRESHRYATGRPTKERTPNLLAGLARCAVCKGGLTVERSKTSKPHYVCTRRRHHHTCDNAMRLPVEETNERVLRAVEEHVLVPEHIQNFLLAVEREDSGDRRAQIEKETADVEKRIARLVAAVEAGGAVESLLAPLKAHDARRQELAKELAAAKPLPRLAPEVLGSRLDGWRRRLRSDVAGARAVLQRVLAERLTFTPYPGGLVATFEAPVRFSGLFAGAVASDLSMREARARIDALGRAYYGTDATAEAVLERAEAEAKRIMEKGERPWRDSNPRSPP